MGPRYARIDDPARAHRSRRPSGVSPARGAFVLALAGLGACLIAYKGNDAVEDVLLNFAGFMAFLVALVPTTVDGSCPTKYVNVVADANTADAVRNNVLTLLIVSAAALGAVVVSALLGLRV